MYINLESRQNHTIEAYSEHEIKIDSVTYEKSLLVSSATLISDLEITSIHDIDNSFLNELLALKPEIIIIGHKQTGETLPIDIPGKLSKQRIGMECMSIGAACRTYNVLLSELRSVIGVFIL